MALKTIDDLKQRLQGKVGDEELSDIAEMVAGMSSRIEEVNREAKKHRLNARDLDKFKKAVMKLGYDPEDGGDLDTYVSNIATKLESDEEPEDIKKNPEYSKLERQLSQMQKQLTEANDKAKATEARARNRTIESMLSKPLNDRLYTSNLIIRDLISQGRVDLDESENVIFKKSEFETTSDLDEGVKWIETIYPDAVKNNQNGGVGSAPGRGGVSDTPYSHSQLENLSLQDMLNPETMSKVKQTLQANPIKNDDNIKPVEL